MLFLIVGVLLLPTPPATLAEEPPLRDPFRARLVAFTILYEATCQPRTGQRLVAHVVVNRLQRYEAPLERVLFQTNPIQFAAWTGERKLDWLLCEMLDDAECFDTLAFRRLGSFPCGGGDADQMWRGLLRVADDVLHGAPPPAGYEGAFYFDNPANYEDGKPPWAPYTEELGCEGDHCFWR